jgi:hypothetical protein
MGNRAEILPGDGANETRATALYERVGMHPAQKFDFYAKRLSLQDAWRAVNVPRGDLRPRARTL